MNELASLFKTFCKQAIADRTTPLTKLQKQQIVESLKNSPFNSVVQAYSVLDFQTYQHLEAQGFDAYLGYKNEEITAEKILDMVHPEDQEAFGKLYYLCLEGLMNLPISTKGIGHFCISYRIRDAWGNYHKILETNNIIECDQVTNIPLVNLAQISFAIDPPKSNLVNYFFKIKDEKNSVAIMHSYLSQYHSKVNIFTDNEIRICQLLKQGMTSQQVAERIFLSKHSIDKYRKNLLAKTETSNTPQLIAYLESICLL